MRVPDLPCLPSSRQTLAGKELPIVDSKQVFGTRMRWEKEGWFHVAPARHLRK
jgi:hypothetical protein